VSNRRILGSVEPIGLLHVVATMPDMAAAGCRDEWSTFDAAPYDEAAELAAVNICVRCPTRVQCRGWYESLHPQDRPAGVVAGLIVPSRRRRAAAQS